MPDGVTIAHAYRDYPEQSEDISYGLSQEMNFTTLVREGADAVALIPDAPVPNWIDVDFDDSGWTLTGHTGVGYEMNSGYESVINLDVGAMRGQNTSVYIRIEFDIAAPSVFDILTLRMKYDDGFIAYLNGDRVEGAYDPASPAWDSEATTGHEASVTDYEDFDITDSVGLLRAGKNVLAIHGLNTSLTSSDMLILPELVAVDLSGGQPDTPMFLTTPTPGKENVTGVLGYISDVRFSIERGFFEEPFDVAITTSTEVAQIYYTLNGSKPTPETGIPYTNAIAVSGTTVLRAAAFKPGYQPSKVGTQTYFFLDDVILQDGVGLPDTWGHAGADYDMDPDVVWSYLDTIIDDMKSVPSVSLVLNQDDFFASGGVGIYPSGEGSPRATSFELIDPADQKEFQIDCSVEICGGSSTSRWKCDKLSMRLRFKEPWGPTKLRFPLYGEEGADRFDTLILDARLNQAWAYGGASSPDSQRRLAQYTRDQYPADLQNALGGYGPRGMATHLYINGVYWGLYFLHERPDESFAAAYFGGDRDDYHVLKHNQNTVVHGSGSDYRAMIQLAASGLSGDAEYQHIQEYLDVPNFVDYMIVNFFIGNTDWAHQNWYATRNVVNPAGRWRYHSWDPEHSLKNLYDNVTSRDDYGGPTGLHQDLRQNPEYRLLFADRVHKHFFNDGALTSENAAAAYGKLLDEVDRAVVGESARWGDNRRPDDPYTRDDEWVTERDRLLGEYFPQRTSRVLGWLRDRGLYPSLQAPVFSQSGGSFPNGFTLSMSASAPVYYTLDGT
ncbi:CotH kinase family protein, partial [bacterium]|nr:CotH kinase family protein [bacterium]